MKTYQNNDLIVYWYPERCAHPGTCLRLLPKVFCADRRPWVDIDAAPAEEIMRCIDCCPSGALQYALPEGSSVDSKLAQGPGWAGYAEQNPAAVKIKAVTNGPFVIEGPVEVYCTDGKRLYAGARTTLCSCGRSANMPFCDGSHRNKD